VLSRASVTEARSRARDEAAVARDLGATYLVSGSVQESGGLLKVSLNLVRPDRTVAWGDSVEGAFDSIFEMQSRLASALTSALVVRVSASDRERMNAPPTTSPQALAAYWQGSALLERTDVTGNVDAAIESFHRALLLDAKFALAHAGLGQAYRRKYLDTREQVWAQRAIEEASVALTLDPDRAEVRYALALTLAGGGRLSEAVAELNRALAIRPNYEEARRQLGAVLAEQQQIDAAVAEFRRAIALRPASPLGYSAMGFALFAASRYAQAAEAFEELVTVAPDSFLGYQQLGTVYHAMGRVDDALANYRKAIAIRPSAPAYTNIGALLHQRGDFEGAVKAYQQALAIRANSTIAHRNLGDALLRLGRAREARAAYLDAVRYAESELKVNPSDTRTMSALAVYLQKSGQPEPARKRIAGALNLAPNNAEVLFRAAVVHALSGDREQALTFLERAAANGYSTKTIATDDDLLPLHGDPRFKQFSKE
jgi:tetratricopeptide (TPR) repeat protein